MAQRHSRVIVGTMVVNLITLGEMKCKAKCDDVFYHSIRNTSGAESGQLNLSILGSLCLHCCMRDK